MRMSDSIATITPAFLKAQMKIESVIKDATNPFFRSKYADLTSVISACKEQLNANGISILQPIDGMTVETILVHSSGEWFSSSTPIVCKAENDPQALGSAITYAKRYGLQSMVLLPAEDDDGNSASTPVKKLAPKKEEKDPTDDWKTANQWDESRTTPKTEGFGVCSQCGDDHVPQTVVEYSQEKLGKIVCYKCQTEIKTGKRTLN